MVVSPDVSREAQQVRDNVFVPFYVLASEAILAWLSGVRLAGQGHGRRIRV
jgi:hypothetical protein